ncbi:Tungsten-containing aldehyde:ferredoxin oxidoreductase (EC [Olavius algarvensis associated proteobacterium Delta 3]|nr:Tungsten-containing aldehyde:ferredoxin oxidoreductase (EC [Olavius algarvensis associated proteobacterium Delta 3]CAB5171550.1 Tungsten-containing aldehyde:ferredoxin oxidoreductase (EC [Olavius algarvensis associated proteobacterium Delta 3]
MLHGYAGTILRIHLTDGRIEKEPLPADLAESYIGGRGFVARLLFDEIEPDIDPCGEKNMFIAATGPLTGHFLPASGKTHFGSKSPATGGYADSNMGGHFGPALKYAGYDAVVLTGKATELSYLLIDDDTVKIRPAEKSRTKGALTAERMLKDDLGDGFQVITIGPAGENGVRFACISHDFGRQAGRTGIGLVLGAKNIKAVAVRGTGGLPVFDVEGAYAKGKEAFAKVRAKPGFKGWTPEGTAGLTNWANEVGAFPTRNFQTSYAEHYRQINGRAILDRLKITDKGCSLCPTPCGKYGFTKTALGRAHVEGPEFETIALFGGNCVLETIEDVAYANYVCDELGLDTISAGVVAAWAIECFEKGILTESQIGRGISFGDLESIVYLLEKTAHRDGIGDLLAQGVKAASESVGKGSEHFAIQVKGLEWTGYECRNAPSMMLAYLTSDIGAHHGRAWVLGHDVAGSWSSVHDLIVAGGAKEKPPKGMVTERSADYVIHSQHERPLFDALGTCRLQLMELGFEGEHYAELYTLITGKQKTWDQLLAVSEKIWHLTRVFNAREIKHFGRSSDYPPRRLCDDPITSGPNEGYRIPMEDIEFLLDAYYAARGWDANGIPTEATLKRVGLQDVVAPLKRLGILT